MNKILKYPINITHRTKVELYMIDYIEIFMFQSVKIRSFNYDKGELFLYLEIQVQSNEEYSEDELILSIDDTFNIFLNMLKYHNVIKINSYTTKKQLVELFSDFSEYLLLQMVNGNEENISQDGFKSHSKLNKGK